MVVLQCSYIVQRIDSGTARSFSPNGVTRSWSCKTSPRTKRLPTACSSWRRSLESSDLTRSLTLTDAGERFLLSIRDHLKGLQSAIAELSDDRSEPSGALKISVGPTFGIGYILPMLPEFMKRYPRIQPEWMFENGLWI
ncbi:hypothetical protein QE372_005272 [Agrobacterium pusense]|nr:hypothetical protein [Agrobacterium pusense]